MAILKGPNSQANINATWEFEKMMVGADQCTRLLKVWHDWKWSSTTTVSKVNFCCLLCQTQQISSVHANIWPQSYFSPIPRRGGIGMINGWELLLPTLMVQLFMKRWVKMAKMWLRSDCLLPWASSDPPPSLVKLFQSCISSRACSSLMSLSTTPVHSKLFSGYISRLEYILFYWTELYTREDQDMLTLIPCSRDS